MKKAQPKNMAVLSFCVEYSDFIIYKSIHNQMIPV